MKMRGSGTAPLIQRSEPGEESLMDPMLTGLALLGTAIIFDLLALRFGVSSRDGRKEVWW